MDIVSYLLGKNAGGSGGGGGEYLNSSIEFDRSTPEIQVGNWIKVIRKVPPFEISNSVTTLNSLYKGVQATEIDASLLDTSNITDMYGVFQNCRNLISLDLTNFNTSRVTAMNGMFMDCSSLQTLNLSSFSTARVTNFYGMFSGCRSLQHLDIRKFTFRGDASSTSMFLSVPANCEIIVKSQTEKDWILNVKSTFTNIKTVEEYENE